MLMTEVPFDELSLIQSMPEYSRAKHLYQTQNTKLAAESLKNGL